MSAPYIVCHCFHTILIGPSFGHKLLNGIYLWWAPIHNEGYDHLVGYSLQELLLNGELIREDGYSLSLIKQGLIESLHTLLYYIWYLTECIPV